MSFKPTINKTYVFLGSRGSGKTTICKQLMREQTALGKGIDSWMVFSNGISQQQYEFLEFKKSPHRLYDTLNLDVITNAFKLNESRKSKGKTLIRFGLVMDDCVDKRSAVKIWLYFPQAFLSENNSKKNRTAHNETDCKLQAI